MFSGNLFSISFFYCKSFGWKIFVVYFSGNRLEKTYALRLLTQLCFEDELAEVISSDLDFHNYARQLSLNAKHHRLRKCAQTLLWWLDNRRRHLVAPNEFVYLSHYHGKLSRRMCARIRVRLEKSGVRVLMAEQINENRFLLSQTLYIGK